MDVIKRKSCRAVLLTPENEILLIKISNPSSEWAGWIVPGGGMDAGETELEGLKRELREELGFKLGGDATPIWKRSHTFPWAGSMYEQDEVFFLVRTPKFQPGGETALTESEMMDFKDMRWWKLDALASSGEITAPKNLAELVLRIVRDGVPSEIETIGV